MKGFPKMLVELAKKERVTFPNLKMAAIGGQMLPEKFRIEIMDCLNARPLVSAMISTYSLPIWK